MALDWSKEISFSGLRKREPRGKDVYPSKTYMNLMVKDRKVIDMRRAIPVGIILLIAVILFTKFGVLDFYNRVNVKQAELNAQQQVLNSLTADLSGYDEVLAKYEAYESSNVGEDGLTVPATEALKLVDTYIAPQATIASLDLSGNMISLSLTNISLDGVGKLVSTLYTQSIVQNVSVSTAATQETDSADVTAAMLITLQPNFGAATGEAAAADGAAPAGAGQTGSTSAASGAASAS